MIVIAAAPPDNGEPDAAQANSPLGLNSPFRGSLMPAEIGRRFQIQHPVPLQELLPKRLASLIERLWEREDGAG